MSLGGATVRPSSSSCGVSRLIVASCGVIWGAATDPNTEAKLRQVEASIGQRFDMIYRFHDLDDNFPTDDERASVAAGRILHVDIDARLFEAPQDAISWQDVSSGKFDASLIRQARGIESLGVPVFVTFDHEPDQARRTSLGSAADFIAAWRHVHDLYRRAGANNVVWVWVVTGYPPLISAAARMWPGNGYVDWISWEAYNASGCQTGDADPAQFQSFGESVLPFYDWLRDHGRASGIDTSKPMMISEAASASYPQTPLLSASWYLQIAEVLDTHRSIRAITLWDRPGATICRYRFDGMPIVSGAISVAIAATPHIRVPR